MCFIKRKSREEAKKHPLYTMYKNIIHIPARINNRKLS